MKQVSQTFGSYDQNGVFHHPQLTDGLLVVLPMIFTVISAAIIAANINPGNPVGIGLFLFIFALSFLGSAVYGSLSLILSLVICCNVTFRIVLVFFLSLGATSCALFFG
jgi:uncharacterized membrane protein